MRGLLTGGCAAVLLLGTAGVSRADENAAERLYKQARAKIEGAKTVQVKFEGGAGEEERWKNCVLLLGGENRLKSELEVISEGKDRALRMVSDGARLWAKDGDSPSHIEDLPAGFEKSLRFFLSGPGLLVGFRLLYSEKPSTEDVCVASDFRMGEKTDKGGGVTLQEITYSLCPRQTEKKRKWSGLRNMEITLSLDVDSGLPVRRVVTLKMFSPEDKVGENVVEDLTIALDVPMDVGLFGIPDDVSKASTEPAQSDDDADEKGTGKGTAPGAKPAGSCGGKEEGSCGGGKEKQGGGK